MTKWLITYIGPSGEGKTEIDYDGVFDSRTARECVEKETGLKGIAVVSMQSADYKPTTIISDPTYTTACSLCNAIFTATIYELSKELAKKHLQDVHNFKTGREWYDCFTEILDRIPMTGVFPMQTKVLMMDVARRAAGLEKRNDTRN